MSHTSAQERRCTHTPSEKIRQPLPESDELQGIIGSFSLCLSECKKECVCVCVFASVLPCNAYTLAGIECRAGTRSKQLPKLGRLATFTLPQQPQKKSFPVFSLLHPDHKVCIPQVTGHLLQAPDIGTHTPISPPPYTHTHTLPQPAGLLAWCGSHAQPLLSWVNPPFSPQGFSTAIAAHRH